MKVLFGKEKLKFFFMKNTCQIPQLLKGGEEELLKAIKT